MNSPSSSSHQRVSVAVVDHTAPVLEKRQVRDAKEKELGAHMASALSSLSKKGGNSMDNSSNSNGGSTTTTNTGANSIGYINDQVMESLIQKIALMEFQAKEAVKKYSNNGPESNMFAELPNLKEHLQELEFLKTIQQKIDEYQIEIHELNKKINDEKIEFQLQEAKRIVIFLEQKVKTLESDKQNLNFDKIDLQNKLTEAKRMLEFMQKKAVTVTDEKKVMELDLSKQIDNLQFRLTEVTRIKQFLETKLIATTKEKEENEKKHVITTSDLEFKLQGVKRVNEYVQNKLRETQNHVKELELQVSKLEFNLAESKRICKFVQDRLLQTQSDKKTIDEHVIELEKEIKSLNLRLTLKNDLIEQQDNKYKQQVNITEQVKQQINEYQSKLLVSSKMTNFLQEQLAHMEEIQLSTNDSKHISLQQQVNVLKEQLEESKLQCNELRTTLNINNDEKNITEKRVRQLEQELENYNNTNNTSYHEQEQQKKIIDLTKHIESLQNQLGQVQHDKNILQEQLDDNVKKEKEKQAKPDTNQQALFDLEFRLTQSEVANKKLLNQIKELQNDKQQLNDKIRNLESSS